jgi:RNA polymerase sigma-70 factor, ECF subfamily
MEREVPLAVTTGPDLERLWRDEGQRLWRAVFAFSHDRAVTDDAVAEAFAQCLRRGVAVRDPHAWIWRAAFRLAAGELKARRRSTPLAIEPVDVADEPPERLLAALAELAPRQRAALVLRYYTGYDQREIARIIGTSYPTVRVHLSRGRRRLRELLEEADR